MSRKGFTLIELLIVIVIISIVATIATLSVNNLVAKTSLNNSVTAIMQLIKEAQSFAKAQSQNVYVVFADDSVTISSSSGKMINSLDFDSNIKFDSSKSTISSDRIVFNYKGAPVSTDGDAYNFDASSGRIYICYESFHNSCKYDELILVQPVTGNLKRN